MDILINCPETGESVKTGIEVSDVETFEFLKENLKENKNRMVCPVCRKEHIWGDEEAYL